MDMSSKTKKELMKLATEAKISGRSKMTKAELADALDATQSPGAPSSSAPSSMETQTVEEPREPARNTPPDYPIPERYDIDTLVCVPVDPRREFAFWELSDETIANYTRQLELQGHGYRIRLFSRQDDVTEMLAEQNVDRMGSWYFDFHIPGRTIWSELGIVNASGTFFPVLTSKRVVMPSDEVSEVIDRETWMTAGEKIEKLYGLSGLDQERVPGSMNRQEFRVRKMMQVVSSSEMTRRDV